MQHVQKCLQQMPQHFFHPAKNLKKKKEILIDCFPLTLVIIKLALKHYKDNALMYIDKKN